MLARRMPAISLGLMVACLMLSVSGCRSVRSGADSPSLDLNTEDRELAQALAYYAQGLIYEGTEGRASERALRAFAKAVELDPGNHMLYAKVATGALLNSMPDEAIRVLEVSCQKQPRSALARIDLATAYQFIGDRAKAISNLRLALELDPSQAPVYMALANMLFLEEKDAEALDVIDHGILHADEPDQLRGYCYNKALSFIEKDESARSLPCFRLVVKYADAERAQVFHLMGQLYEGLGQKKEAIESYRLATLEPDPAPQAFVKLAILRAQDGGPEAAVQTLIDADDLLPNNAVVLLALGQIYIGLGQMQEAIDTYARILDIVSESKELQLSPSFFLQYGSACERNGEFDRAIELFETCLKKFPDAHQVLNYAAYMWAERGIKLTRALSYIDRALAIEPENAAYLDTRGWILYKKGDIDGARHAIQAALERMPNDPTINEHMGDVWQASGNRDEAIRYWKISYQRAPESQAVADKLMANGVEVEALVKELPETGQAPHE